MFLPIAGAAIGATCGKAVHPQLDRRVMFSYSKDDRMVSLVGTAALPLGCSRIPAAASTASSHSHRLRTD
ncbi:hypothetical protein [Streptomyces cinereospinus]|uniref:Uncharacterized protein n=1 Tax=Streptomyces cinereospinus TaxID=285561 RepID=A0ABV5N8I8_9ACTN